ncbi:acyl-CoA dehydrogenase family protein [Rugamonas rubra]|uniref:Acyl-CoA dehydrogenase n=1 Tax=Rugamonas rubra TaxID=758825 RepID=A0A1I4LER3_9BURK|nr:acyl-CoA dehydrogenase family protein [Rugamonas rubra]SFL89420.1 Acyl-CoA dehydrogenase [Rugamonas rubra]
MAALNDWLREHAEALDQSQDQADAVMPQLAAGGRFRVGVPTELGGDGGDVRDAIRAIAEVAEQSVTAAFVYWGQRTFIEYLLHSPNAALRERLLPALLDGRLAGATGLSNAMKFLSGMEPLQINAEVEQGGWRLDGQLAWVTNLHPAHFVVAAAVAPSDAAPPVIVVFDSEAAGVQRGANLELIALRGSHTAAVKLTRVAAGPEHVISADAANWLPRVRPAFLGMQCGMSIGLARASLAQAAGVAGSGRGPLGERIAAARLALDQQVETLLDGVATGRFVSHPAEMFRLRIALAGSVQEALMLELQARGGLAYLEQHQQGFGRRWRESAFIPVITPSLTQLQAALAKQAAEQAAERVAERAAGQA